MDSKKLHVLSCGKGKRIDGKRQDFEKIRSGAIDFQNDLLISFLVVIMENLIPNDKPVFSQVIRVSEHDIDELHHVNNISYLKWVLDAAQSHWLALTSESLRSKYKWVVLRHEIDYLKPAILNDALKIMTWVEWHSGARSERQVKIFRDDQLLVSAKTIWCLLDARTMKPKRIDDDITGLYEQSTTDGA